MRIAIITNLYPPYARGGAEVVITRTVTELLAQGHQVTVVTTRPWGGFKTLFPRLEDRFNERIYRFYPLNIYHPLKDFRYPAPVRLIWHLIDMFNPLNAIFVRDLIKELRPDIVWTHNLKGIGLTIPLGFKSLGIPHVHQVHDVQLSVASGLIIAGHERPPLAIRFSRAIYTRICALLLGSPAVVISPSQFLKYFYERRGFFKKSQVVVLPNPAPKIPSLERGKRTVGPLRILFVGQLESHKGIRFLLKSLETFDAPFELSIAGEGNLSRFVQQTARKDSRFHFVGFLAMDQLLRMFQMADALVVPSRCYENSPTVIYEALQAGVPVVAANIGGVAELIQEGGNGYLFQPGNQQDLVRKLHLLDQNKERLREKEAEIRETVADHAIDKYVERITTLFQGISVASREGKVL